MSKKRPGAVDGALQYLRESSSLRRRAGAVTLAGATAATAGTFLAARALRRWGRSALAAEELVQLPEAKMERLRRPDGAEISVFISAPGVSEGPAAEPKGARGAGADEGPGSLFVLAHGWTNDSRVWAPVARRLVERGHTVVTYDQRGHGSSSAPPSTFTLENLAEDLRAVLDHVDARQALVAGHSMGGIAAQALAATHPERVRERVSSLVLVASACDRVGGNALAKRLGPVLMTNMRLERAMSLPALGPFLVRRTVGKEACRAHLQSICEMFVGTSPEARTGFLSTLLAVDLSEAIAGLDLPVTVVAGERDNLLPRVRSRRIAELVPGARLVEIEGAGHMLPIEVPERVADLLVDSTRSVRPAERPPQRRST
jgi:non-heme chloroperoxidase